MNDYMKAKRETRGNKNGYKTSEWEQYTQYTRLKRNAYYKIFNIFLRRNQVHLDWKDILLVVEVYPWASPLCLVPEKKTWHLGLSRSKSLSASMGVSSTFGTGKRKTSHLGLSRSKFPGIKFS